MSHTLSFILSNENKLVYNIYKCKDNIEFVNKLLIPTNNLCLHISIFKKYHRIIAVARRLRINKQISNTEFDCTIIKLSYIRIINNIILHAKLNIDTYQLYINNTNYRYYYCLYTILYDIIINHNYGLTYEENKHNKHGKYGKYILYENNLTDKNDDTINRIFIKHPELQDLSNFELPSAIYDKIETKYYRSIKRLSKQIETKYVHFAYITHNLITYSNISRIEFEFIASNPVSYIDIDYNYIKTYNNYLLNKIKFDTFDIIAIDYDAIDDINIKKKYINNILYNIFRQQFNSDIKFSIPLILTSDVEINNYIRKNSYSVRLQKIFDERLKNNINIADIDNPTKKLYFNLNTIPVQITYLRLIPEDINLAKITFEFAKKGAKCLIITCGSEFPTVYNATTDYLIKNTNYNNMYTDIMANKK